MHDGKIMKALSGFYYVEADGKLYTCKGRGVFRNKKITPLVGDIVDFDMTDHNEGYITTVKPRSNELERPPVANVTQGIIVSSIVEPAFSTLLIDRFIALLESKQIKPIILMTKMDIADEQALEKVKQFQRQYQAIGYTVFLSDKTEHAAEVLNPYLKDEVSVLVGQSGVGKSTILNMLNPALTLNTGEISKSLGRGKHTTRHVELLKIGGGLVADTPGFSSLEFKSMTPEELAASFIEIDEYGEQCKFRSCLHDKEPHCAVKNAVENGEITYFRYEHYLNFLQEILMRKPRY